MANEKRVRDIPDKERLRIVRNVSQLQTEIMLRFNTFMCEDVVRYEIPEEFCPICQFIEYSEYDLAHYLEKQYGVSRDEVFAEVKKVNKRRKKLYENEYITFVCQKFNLNPTEIVAGWKEKFGTYANFHQYLRKK